MDWLLTLNSIVNSIVWGPPMMLVLVGSGLFLTIATRGVQFRRFAFAARQVYRAEWRGGGQGTVTPLKAFATALSATVGVGNVAGVSIAIAAGGPGAVFWMLVTGLVGMATKFSEIAIVLEFRQKDRKRGLLKREKGEYQPQRYFLGQRAGVIRGGAMHVLANRFRMPWLGALFACFCAMAAFGIGNMAQANTVATGMQSSYGIPEWASGLGLSLLTALVVLGGIRRIADLASVIVPAMCGLYVLCSLVIVFTHLGNVPAVIELVMSSAFTGHAALGGFAGAAFRGAVMTGVARGLFSNEAGLGSAPIAHSAAVTDHPVRQAAYGIVGVFIDTLVICSFTAFTVLATGVWTSGSTGAELASMAFSQGLPGQWGSHVVTLAILLFGFSTILGWAFYGETGFTYLFGDRMTLLYRLAFIGAVFVGAVGGLEPVWAIADTLNALMAVPNLIAVLGSVGLLRRRMSEFFAGNA